MKKILCLFVSVVMILSFAACSKTPEKTNVTQKESKVTEEDMIKSMSAKEYLAFAVTQKSAVSQKTGEILALAKERLVTTGEEGSLSVSLGEGFEPFLAAADKNYKEYFDKISWIKNASIGYTGAMDADRCRIDAEMTVNDGNPLNFSIVMDGSDNGFYFYAPDICGKALYTQSKDIIDLDATGIFNDPAKFIPDPEMSESVLNRYIGIVLENLDSVSRKSTELEVNGVSGKATEISVNLTPETLYNTLYDIIDNAKDDSELETLLKFFISNELDGTEDIDVDEIYDGFIAELSVAKKDLEDNKKDYIEEMADASAVVKVWTNTAHEIIAVSFILDEEEIFAVKSMKATEESSFELMLRDTLKITARFEDVDEVFGGEITVYAANKRIFDITVTDVDSELYDKGIFFGTISMKIADEAVRAFDLPTVVADSKLTLTINDSGNKSLRSIKLSYKEADVITVTGEAGEIENAKVIIPENVINIDSPDFVQELIPEISLYPLIEIATSAGCPKEFLDSLMLVQFALTNY